MSDAAERARIDALTTPLLARAATPYIALSSAANVVLQLSWPQIGHGVADSRVEGARLFDDPRRRRRTTAGFLAVAVLGNAHRARRLPSGGQRLARPGEVVAG